MNKKWVASPIFTKTNQNNKIWELELYAHGGAYSFIRAYSFIQNIEFYINDPMSIIESEIPNDEYERM